MPAISPVTASKEGPDTVGFRSSGTSPGDNARTLHLVGAGQVGQRFLRLLPGTSLRLCAVSDSTATVFDREGLDPLAIAAHKQQRRPLRDFPGAAAISAEVATSVVAADVVADATGSEQASTAAAVARGRAALRNGAFLALCAKNALAAASAEWLGTTLRQQVGCNAALGGAGLQLVRELDELRARCTGLELAGNVTSTVIIQAIERGASLEQGIEHARQLGILEPDPELDLDGSDAAVKLAAVWGALFGGGNPEVSRIARQHVRELDVDRVRERASRGATTRLLARGDRDPQSLRVQFTEVPATSPLAAPPDRVVYSYRLGQGLRVHTGLGVGYQGTAEALLADVVQREVRR
jgi:homoserine dehydrogenase